MIHYSQDPNKKINKIIKYRCKIKSYFYNIQIYTNSSIENKKITFLIKASANKINFTLFKKSFDYDELLKYNKYFQYFNSIENIFAIIEQCILEKKFTVEIIQNI